MHIPLAIFRHVPGSQPCRPGQSVFVCTKGHEVKNGAPLGHHDFSSGNIYQNDDLTIRFRNRQDFILGSAANGEVYSCSSH